MGVITVEKHLFFIEAQGQRVSPSMPNKAGNVPAPHFQVHLRIRQKRLPWEGSVQRTLGYLDTHQLPRNPGNVGTNLEAMQRFLLGKGYEHPKLLIADVGDSRFLMSKSTMSEYLFNQYRVRRRPEWARTHPVHFGQDVMRDAWLPYDPTQPGKKAPSRDVWLREAHAVLHDKVFGTEMYRGEKKSYDQKIVIPIGVAFRIRYFTTNYPRNIVWPPRLQARVKTYLTKTLGPKSMEWYAIGEFEQPASLKTMRGKSPEQIRAFMAARINQTGEKKIKVYRKILAVEANHHAQAQQAAEEKLSRFIQQPGQRTKGMDLLNAWERGGRLVYTRQRWESYKQRSLTRSSRG